jgi:hypothetical protein
VTTTFPLSTATDTVCAAPSASVTNHGAAAADAPPDTDGPDNVAEPSDDEVELVEVELVEVSDDVADAPEEPVDVSDDEIAESEDVVEVADVADDVVAVPDGAVDVSEDAVEVSDDEVAVAGAPEPSDEAVVLALPAGVVVSVVMDVALPPVEPDAVELSDTDCNWRAAELRAAGGVPPLCGATEPSADDEDAGVDDEDAGVVALGAADVAGTAAAGAAVGVVLDGAGNEPIESATTGNPENKSTGVFVRRIPDKPDNE